MRRRVEELDDGLARAVPPATATAVRTRSLARRRVRSGTVVVALGVAVTALIAAVTLTAVHTRRPPPAERPTHLGRHGRFPIRPGEIIYPLGAVATKAQLLANFGVLRRAQDARDKSWRPDCSCGGAARQFYRLTRYARSLPDGNRVLLDVEQFIYPGQLNTAAGSYVLNFDLVFPNGNTNSAAFGPNTGYLVYPVADRGPDNTRGVPQVNDWVSVIPDGVTTARWTFACDPNGGASCRAGARQVYTVPVVENVAARTVPDSGPCPGCAQPVAVQWLNGRGDVIASFGSRRGNLTAPPFVKGGRGTRDLDVLEAGGIATARLGEPSAQAITALGSLFGAPAQTNVRTGGCGIDHESVWTSPSVAYPLTIFQRAGRFVGYRYGAPAPEIGLDPGPGATLHTARGLTIGATVGSARRLYGHRVTTRVARGQGSWSAAIGRGRIGGAVLPIRYPLTSIGAKNPIVTIGAGDSGC